MRKSMILFFFLLLSSLGALEKRESVQPMKTSVIIPCHVDHYGLLEKLLDYLKEQTVSPDEVVVSLSEYEQIPPLRLQTLESKEWPFCLKILKQKGKYPPGRNRNEACSAATGDLIICQDADDLPHPQRVEVIKYLFEHFKIDHLIHQWIPSGKEFEPCYLEQMEAKSLYCRYYFQLDSMTYIHNGSSSFVRRVFDQVHWKPMTAIQEDVLFNQAVYSQFSHKAVLSVPLILYRFELSTFDLNGDKGKN